MRQLLLSWSARFAKPHQELMQVGSVLARNRFYFHSQSVAGRRVTNDCFRTNLTFLNQKMKIQHVAFTLTGSSFNEKARRTEIFHAGNVAEWAERRLRFPIHPYIIGD